MSYNSYSYYSTSSFSSSSHTGLELLLGAAELLEGSSLPATRDGGRGGEVTSTSKSSFPASSSSNTTRRRRAQRHPFRSTLESSIDSRWRNNMADSDSRESDVMHARPSLPFTTTATTSSTIERTSASWPMSSSSCSSSGLIQSSSLFVPSSIAGPTLHSQRTISSPSVATAVRRSSQTRCLEESDKQKKEQDSLFLSSSAPSSSSYNSRPTATATTTTIKRAQTAISCMRCRSTHKKCDEQRPCKRCVRVGRGDCEDAPARGLKLKTSPRELRQELPFDVLELDSEVQLHGTSSTTALPSLRPGLSHPFT